MATTLDLKYNFLVTDTDEDKRLDVYLSEKLPPITRSAVKALIKDGSVSVEGKGAKASHKVRTGESVHVKLHEPEPSTLTPEDIPIEILFEDEHIIIVNKPPGLTVHPGAGRRSGTLANALLHHTEDLSNVGGPLRPGIVHRLDKDTSGVLAVAKTNESHLNLSTQFKEHTTSRHYHALVWGSVKKDAATIEMPIGRDSSDRKKISPRARYKRKAVTHYSVTARYGYFTLLDVTLETGRTHQIRVHLSETKHPVVGDATYGKRKTPSSLDKTTADMVKGLTHQCLHAIKLGLTHPVTGKRMEFTALYPPEMEAIVKRLDETATGDEGGQR